MFKRSDRLRELFLKEVTRAVSTLKDPGLAGFLTITDLTLSGDMKTAHVYFSVLGSAEDRSSTAEALTRSTGYLRQLLLQKLTLKYVPKLVFEYDQTPERAHRIENLLNRIHAEGELKPPAPAGAPEDLSALASRKRRKRSRRG